MRLFARLSVLVIVLSVAACGGAPPAEVSPSPAASPSASPEPTAPTSTPPEATDSPSPAPTDGEPSPSPAGPTASPAPTPTAAAQPTPSFAPTTVPGSWAGPERISERAYDELSLVVDGQGMAHAAARLGDGIFYLTNAGGSWTRERISRPPQAQDEEDVGYVDREPSIAIDADGSLWVAFTRMFDFENFGPYPEGIYLVTNRSGSWSSAVQLVGDTANSPSLKVRGGHIFFAYVDGRSSDAYDPSARYPVRYGTDLGGSLAFTRVARHGDLPQLELDTDGRPHILFASGASLGNPDGLSYALGAAPSGSFTVEHLPGTTGNERRAALAVDQSADAHAVWNLWPEDAAGPSVSYARRADGSWSSPEELMRDAGIQSAIAADPARPGVLHVGVGGEAGVWYLTDRRGSFQSERLSRQEVLSLDLAVDGGGRPHVLFMTGIDEGDVVTGHQLWYGTGPAD